LWGDLLHGLDDGSILLDETSMGWKHDRSTHKTTMDGGNKENKGRARKRQHLNTQW
jgi:hypothetical protein